MKNINMKIIKIMKLEAKIFIPTQQLKLNTDWNLHPYFVCYLNHFLSFQVGMDRRDFVLATIFGTFGVLGILIGLGLAAWFYFRSKRPKRSAGDCEDSMDNGENPSQKLTKKNGFLNLKTPLISTKTLGWVQKDNKYLLNI